MRGKKNTTNTKKQLHVKNKQTNNITSVDY